jgi:hypothetical protein
VEILSCKERMTEKRPDADLAFSVTLNLFQGLFLQIEQGFVGLDGC